MEQLLDYRRRLLESSATVIDDIESALEHIPEHDRHEPLRPGQWSAHQIISHLRDTFTREFYPCLERIQDEETPKFECFEPQAWMTVHYQPEEPAAEILAEYRRLLDKELKRLQKQPPEVWSRIGRHPIWGERTLQWWLEQSLAHAKEHLKQLQSAA